jgi:hypothetical protein
MKHVTQFGIRIPYNDQIDIHGIIQFGFTKGRDARVVAPKDFLLDLVFKGGVERRFTNNLELNDSQLPARTFSLTPRQAQQACFSDLK